MMVIVWSALALGVLAVALMGLAAYGRSRWATATQALLGQLEDARVPPRASRYDARELEGLPASVQRYFRGVLKDRQPIVTVVTVRHTGTFNVTALGGRERWMPFTSEQRVLTNRPGFVWNARMFVAPGIDVLVHDAYAGGVGTLHPAVLGVFSLANNHGTGDIARRELMRFTFGEDGLIESVRDDARGAMVGGKLVMMPWEGRMSNYQERNGLRVPLTGEAAWLPQGERKPYWRGTITSARYEFAIVVAAIAFTLVPILLHG